VHCSTEYWKVLTQCSACGAGVVRFVYSMKHLENQEKLGPLSLPPVAACASGEAAAAIVCANLPLLPAFIKHFRRHQAKSYTHNRSYSHKRGTSLIFLSKYSRTTATQETDDLDGLVTPQPTKNGDFNLQGRPMKPIELAELPDLELLTDSQIRRHLSEV
jgi:hypothetical protein